MNKILFRTICIALITVSTLQLDRIDQLVSSKLLRSKPQGSDILAARYLNFTTDMGYKYAKDVKREKLSKIKDEKYGLKILFWDYEIFPYKEAMALKWGTGFEALSYKMRINTSKDASNRVDVYAMIGERKNEDCQLRTAWGISHATSLPLTKKVRYQHCWTEWFTKKCETRYKYVYRGMTLSEMIKSKIGLIRRAHQNAVTKYKVTGTAQNSRLFARTGDEEVKLIESADLIGPRSLIEFNYLSALGESEPKDSGRQFVAYKVPFDNVVASVSGMINNTIDPSLSSKLKTKVKSKKSGTFYHTSKDGKYKIELIKESGNYFTVAVGL